MNFRSWVDIGGGFEAIVDWLRENLAWLFGAISRAVTWVLDATEFVLTAPPAIVGIVLFVAIAWYLSGRGVAIFTFVGFGLIWYMGLWTLTMSTLALVATSVFLALLIGVPLGIWSSKNDVVWNVTRPILDFMQTLPAFVYLIPAVLFFRLGPVPGVVATLVFSVPPAVRLTNLGIRQVPREIKEAALSFGSTGRQMLIKAELPIALATIMAGINQTIMLALSMVVIAGMIGAGGLGNEVLRGITQLRIDVGFEAGIAIVILAIFLDRITQALASGGRSRSSVGA